MCYSGECKYEMYGGPDKGECRKPGDVDCPHLLLNTVAQAQTRFGIYMAPRQLQDAMRRVADLSEEVSNGPEGK